VCRLVLGLLLFAFAPLLQAQAPRIPLTVGQITITNVGPKNVSQALVFANIRTKTGDSYSRSSIDNDVRTLYATGYFDNIQVREERVGEKVNLIYLLEGKLKITDILFTGNKKYSTGKLRKQITSKIGEPLDYRKLFNDREAIKKLYTKAGMGETKVETPVTSAERSGSATVTYAITEAPKIRVVNVLFEGANAFKQGKLRKVVKTRRWWWLSWLTGSGKIKPEEMDQDEDRLTEFYQNQGYIDFDLKQVKVVNLTPTRADVVFVVSEGRPYKVGAIGVKGATIYTTNQILSKLTMNVSNTFSPKGLTKDVDTVQDLYGTKGYIDAKVLPQKQPNTETGTMDLVLNLEEGEKSYIEKIEIKGNTKTRDKVIRRELAVSPGEVFNMVDVKKSKLRLEGLNYFERVETQAEPTDVKDHKNLVIAVTEKNTGSFMVGAGFSTIDSLVGFIELNQGNFDLFNPPWFTGGGQKLRLRVAIGTERQDYVLTFIEPWFLGRKLTLNTELYYRDLNYVSLNDLYQERIAGVRLGLTKALGSDFLIGGVNYNFENVNLDLNQGYIPDQYDVPTPGGGTTNIPGNISQQIYNSAGDYLVSKVGSFLSFDTRGGGFLPTRGQRSELRADVAGGPLGGNVDTYRLEARTAWYFPGFATNHVLELGGRIGVIDSYGDSTSVPLFQEWFLGGLDSLRGFKFRDVGPKDRFGEPLGGNTYWFGTAEYSIPVIERVRFAVFFDAGMVYPGAYSFTPQSTYFSLNNPPEDFTTGFYNCNWGVGIRLNLPIGPLRLDYGIPIKSDSFNDSHGRFQFSAGYTRDF
jgi:outer membrane protein insertion porin family